MDEARRCQSPRNRDLSRHPAFPIERSGLGPILKQFAHFWIVE